MAYESENRLNEFVFQNCEMNLSGYDGNTIMMNAEYLSVSKNSAENPHGCDMQADGAVLSLGGFTVQRFFISSWNEFHEEEYDEFGIPIEDGSLRGEEAVKAFCDELRRGIAITDFGIHMGGGHFLSAMTTGGKMLEVRFMFSSAKVSWEGYSGKAWYENRRR